MTQTRCAGSDVAIGVTGEGYASEETVECPDCHQEVRVYLEWRTVRLRDHLRAVA